MKKTNWLLWVIVLGVGLVVQTAAQQAVLKNRGTLRKDPSSKNPPIMRLDAGMDVELIDPTPTRGYYHVRTSDPEAEGWIYSRGIDIAPTTGPAAAPTPTAPTPGTPPTSASGVASAFSPDWEKPAPNSTTFAGPDGDCGPTGDGGDSFTNARKNRSDDATGPHEVTWKALQSLPFPAHAPRSLAQWTSQQMQVIQPYEGVPVSVVGYLVKIKVEDTGSGESTNCHFVNPNEVDWHMPFAERFGDAEATAVVVETTPRIRKEHPNWATANLSPWVNSNSPVRISGWTLLDPEHGAQIGKFRSTLWEVHPVTKIEVFKDGQWVNADNLP
jgi:hypothetical protein